MSGGPIIGAGIGALGGLLGRGENANKLQSNTQQGSSAGSRQGQSSYTPNAAAMPFYGYTAGQANQLMQSPVPFFPGQTYIGPSQPTQIGTNLGMAGLMPQLQGAGMMMGAVPGQQAAANSARGNYSFLSNAADVGSNPYVQQMAQTNRDRVGEALREDWLPALDLGVSRGGSGAVGSSRHGLAQGEAVQNAARELGRANTELMLDAYGQGLTAQQNALGSLAGVQQGLLAPGQTYAGAGQLMGNAGAQAAQIGQGVEGYQQRALEDAMGRFAYQYSEPYQRLALANNAAQMLFPLGVQNQSGVSSSRSSGAGVGANPNYQSPWQAGIGGAASGAGLFGSIFG